MEHGIRTQIVVANVHNIRRHNHWADHRSIPRQIDRLFDSMSSARSQCQERLIAGATGCTIVSRRCGTEKSGASNASRRDGVTA